MVTNAQLRSLGCFSSGIEFTESVLGKLAKETETMRSKWIISVIVAVSISMMAYGATINYRLVIDGLDHTTEVVNPGDVPIDVFFDVFIEVNVPDANVSGYYCGVLQYSVNLGDSGDALTPEEYPNPTYPEKGFWSSSSTSPMANFPGMTDVNGYDVYGQTGAVYAGDFAANFNTFGAGPDVWSRVGTGWFKWNGKATLLTLVPYELSAMLVYNGDPDTNYVGNPTAANGDSVTFVPEPATLSLLSLLAIGGLAMLKRKK